MNHLERESNLHPARAERLREELPGVASLLKWVYLGRLSVVISIVIAAAFFIGNLSRVIIIAIAVAAFASAAITALSAFSTHVRRVPPGPVFLYTQVLFDLALVTVVVWVTGGVSSDFASLYIPVIAITAVTLPIGSTIVVTIAAAALYLGAGLLSDPMELSIALWLQLGVFFVVAMATAWLASRVRLVGAQRRELEQEVRHLRIKASDILQEISGGIITVEGDGALVFANTSAEELLGFSSSDFLGKPFLSFLSGRSQELWSTIVATQRDGRRQVRVEGSIRLDGRAFPIGVTTTSHQVRGDDLPSVTAIFTDISDQQSIDELKVRTERLEAVAALSASLAHEIKNPLASIRSSVEQLGQSARADEDDKFLAELILRESDRLSRLLSEFLDFTRVRITESHTVDVHTVARAAVELVREHPDCPTGAQIQLVGTETRIQGDEDLLHRIVVNLVLNALQAAEGDASVTVEVGELAASDLPPGVPTEKRVMLRVTDTGPGIPAAIRSRLFDPFVTGRQGGTGLGLAIVQRAVEAHQGLVFVDSRPGRGTTFRVYLPLKRAAEAAA